MLDEALEQVNMAVRYLPGDAILREHLGDIYFAKGKLKEAVLQWETALELDPGNGKLEKKLKRRKAR
jgi:protein involved in temperature-dependent protein secretion